MLKTIMTACAVLALGALGACSTASGPTYTVRAVDLEDGSRAYTVECNGLLESSRSCMAAAQRVCHDKPVHILNQSQALKGADAPLTDPRGVTFVCLQPQAKADPELVIGGDLKTPVVPPQVVLSADAVFAFDHGDVGSISDDGRKQLDDLAEKVRAAGDVQNVTVTGYTDRLGSDAYNVRLSQQRAEAVAQYLQKAGVTAKIDAHGAGKASPGTKCDPRDTQDRESLIQCLSPDRRVEIRLTVEEATKQAN